MKKILFLPILAAVSLFGGSFSWHESVKVVRSKPIYRTVTIRTPYQVCWWRNVPVCRENLNTPAAALIGSAAGGVLGHQIGKGHGKEAATIGGAVVGALVGANLAEQNCRVVYRRRRVCETRYKTHTERRLLRYKNIAWYRGHRIVKFSQRPLHWIDVKVRAEY
ncbi:glycine zipper 2TM domain-containing protein [Nitratifractor sp.]|uniref:glycine zipper 2TM domain-containing protein n=1 Tax=Nitratifractor sp. TaxID=2268144 RepID=UPI0025FAA321|nr:glycine zipper 2TM domain-containing protein [Nitratifractor sp.]